MSKIILSVTAAALASLALSASPAHAHINVDGVLKSRPGDKQKIAPCGGEPRTGTPYVFEPGATIQLGVAETVLHDGYFRVSFDNDGEDGFVDPKSIDPLNPNRYGEGKKCQGTPEDNCGKSDFCSVVSKDGGPTVLWDNLDPHVTPTALANPAKKWSWTVRLPNVECENCTIQVMQVMEDPVGSAHGPFDGKGDLYYRCIDIQLKKGVGKTPGTVDPATAPANKTGIDCVNAAPPSGPAAPAAPDAGSTAVVSGVDAGLPAATTDGGPLGLEFGDVDESSAEVSEQAGGCSLASSSASGWSQGALALLMGGLLAVRSRRRRQ